MFQKQLAGCVIIFFFHNNYYEKYTILIYFNE